MDPLTRMADQLRAEKERLTNELESYKKTALIAQYDAIMTAVEALIGTYVLADSNNAIREALDAIAQHDPRKGAE